MIEQFENNEKRKVNGFNSLFFTSLIIIFCCLVLFFDKGPLLPPYSSTFESFDCNGVKLIDFVDKKGTLSFTFSASKSVEYPPEYLPNFIYVTVNTGLNKIQYNGEYIENYSRTSDNLTFNIPHRYGGPTKIKAQCLHQSNDTFDVELSNPLPSENGFSRSDDPIDDVIQMHDACLEYDKFLFFTNIYSPLDKVPFDNSEFRYESLNMKLQDYLNEKKVDMIYENTFFISQVPNETWKSSMFWAAPIADSLDAHQEDEILFMTKEVPSQETKKNLKIITENPPVNKSDIDCFSSLQMTRTMYDVDINNDEQMYNIVKNYSSLRKYFVTDKETKFIIIGEEFGDFYEDIRNAFPNEKLFMLRRKSNNLLDVADKCGNAKVLVGSHVSSLAHAVWLPENAEVIDATPAEFSCNPWVSEIANSKGLRYSALMDGECTCNSFSCYPNEASVVISREDLIAAIKSSLEHYESNEVVANKPTNTVL